MLDRRVGFGVKCFFMTGHDTVERPMLFFVYTDETPQISLELICNPVGRIMLQK